MKLSSDHIDLHGSAVCRMGMRSREADQHKRSWIQSTCIKSLHKLQRAKKAMTKSLPIGWVNTREACHSQRLCLGKGLSSRSQSPNLDGLHDTGVQEEKQNSETLQTGQNQNQTLPVGPVLKPGSSACPTESSTCPRITFKKR